MFLKEEYSRFLAELNDVYEGMLDSESLVEMANELQEIIFDTSKSLEEVFGVVMRYENSNGGGYESFVFSLVISVLPDSKNQVLRAYDFLLGYHDFNLLLFVMSGREHLTQKQIDYLMNKIKGVFDKQLLQDYGFMD